MSLVIWGTATVSAMPSTTRTSELRHSTTRIHQRRELRVSIGRPFQVAACAHCSFAANTVRIGGRCAQVLFGLRCMRTSYAGKERHGGQGEPDPVGVDA